MYTFHIIVLNYGGKGLIRPRYFLSESKFSTDAAQFVLTGCWKSRSRGLQDNGYGNVGRVNNQTAF